jgi:hypothetical protein
MRMADYIDFISAYCDRWCERCRFTSRCSTFAASAAIAMCGDDVAAGPELAAGPPADMTGGPAIAAAPWGLLDIDAAPAASAESAEPIRLEWARAARLDSHPLMQAAHALSMTAHRWFVTRHDALYSAARDPVLEEALSLAMHDAVLIAAKLHRALDGRDRAERRGRLNDPPAQTDWNGSAKVALVCLERSAAAWQVIAQAGTDDTPSTVAAQMTALVRDVEETFPHARSFVRPGFDEMDA